MMMSNEWRLVQGPIVVGRNETKWCTEHDRHVRCPHMVTCAKAGRRKLALGLLYQVNRHATIQPDLFLYNTADSRLLSIGTLEDGSVTIRGYETMRRHPGNCGL